MVKRLTILLAGGSAAVGVLASCGAPVATGPIIGVPPPAAATSAAAGSDDQLIEFQKTLEDQLKQVNLTQNLNEAAPIETEVNALLNDPSLILAERFQALQTLGAQVVARGEHAVSGLINLVQSDARLNGVLVGGQPLREQLLGRLSASQQHLQAMGVQIAGDTLVDVLRVDVIQAATSTRVSGLMVPMTHLCLAAGAATAGATQVWAINRDLLAAIQNGRGFDRNYTREVNLSNQVVGLSTTIQSVAGRWAQAVLNLTPAGFPGDKQVLVNARAALSGLRGQNGTFLQAIGLLSQIRQLLSQR